MGLAFIEGGGGGGVTSDDVTARRADILAGKRNIASDSNDEIVEGTMPDSTVSHALPINGSFTIPAGYHDGSGTVSQSITTKAAQTYYATTSDQTIASGQYLSGAQTIKKLTQTNLTGANIKPGVTISVNNGNTNVWSVASTMTSKAAATYYATTSDQTIAAGQYLNGAQTIKKLTATNLTGGNIKPGVTISVNNGSTNVWSVAGTMTSKAATTYYPTTSDQTIASGQYLSGAQTIKAVTQQNLVASNIKKGVTVYVKNGSGNIFAVTGTWEGYVPTANQPFNRGAWGSGWSIVGQEPRESNYAQAVTITYPGSSIHLVPANPSEQGYPGGAYVYLKKITMNGINTINISMSGNIGTIESNHRFVVLGIWNTIQAQFYRSSATVYAQTSSTLVPTSETTLSINVASITTDQYIAFGAFDMASAKSYLDITRIWFT